MFEFLENPAEVAGELKKGVLSQKKQFVSSRRRVNMETKCMEEKIASEPMHKREETELRQQQRELELLAKGEAMESAGTQREIQLVIELKRLHLEDMSGSSGDSLSSVTS